MKKILRLAENIGNAYKEADFQQKRIYLGIFLKRIYIKAGKISDFDLTDGLKELIEEGSVQLRTNWGGFLSKFRTALLDSSNYIPKYPEFENVAIRAF